MTDMAEKPTLSSKVIYAGVVRPSTQKSDDNKARRAHTDEFLAGVDSCLDDNEIREPKSPVLG